jgi:hypothetical protein
MLLKGETKTVKMRVGNYMYPVTLTCTGTRIETQFAYNPKLQAEIKLMQGAKYHGFDEKNPRKIWSIANSFRNWFQIRYLMGENVYAWYDRPVVEHAYSRDLMKHQKMLADRGLTYHYCIWAAEMGTGKTLAAIEVAERSGLKDIWYVGPKSGVKAVALELIKWESKIKPRMITYEQLVTLVSNWTPGQKAPQMVIFDECSKIKTPTAKRSQAAFHVSEAMRLEHGIENTICLLLSGTPAPKSPVDWWHQAEVTCPGFLKEGDINKFKSRLCLTEQRESLAGGMYPHMITWLDDENKCKICGQYADHGNHLVHSKQDTTKAIQAAILKQGFTFGGGAEKPKDADVKQSSVGPHAYEASKNEVAYLFERMKGLVTVLFKKDCMDLPEKRYIELRAQPTVDMIRAARMINSIGRTAVQKLILMRELSDGFQYEEVETGEVECSACHGTGEREIPIPISEEEQADREVDASKFKLAMMPCDKCDGSGQMPKMSREAKFCGTPKDEVLIDLLEDHEEVGRCIVWGGFQATIDRVVDICHKQGWSTLRIDGRGYMASDPLGNVLDANECLIAMDASHKMRNSLREKHDRLCVVSNAKAGGMALTFTASPSEIFYSNGFDGEARFQAEDRFHRRGADANRGCTIYDIICLPTDLLVLNNLKKKRKLQDMSLGELNDAMKELDNVK